ncbi:hypothetical protein Aduo_013645 [Ancylostoma duodenale]
MLLAVVGITLSILQAEVQCISLPFSDAPQSQQGSAKGPIPAPYTPQPMPGPVVRVDGNTERPHSRPHYDGFEESGWHAIPSR